MTGSSDVKIAPEIFTAHAQFGGDLELMQKAYEWHDLKAKVRELEDLVAEYRDHSQPYWEDRANKAEAGAAALLKTLKFAKDHAEFEDEVLDVVDDVIAEAEGRNQ